MLSPVTWSVFGEPIHDRGKHGMYPVSKKEAGRKVPRDSGLEKVFPISQMGCSTTLLAFRKCIPPNKVHRQHNCRDQCSRSRGTGSLREVAKMLALSFQPHPTKLPNPLKTHTHVPPHKSQEHQENKADEPPCCRKGLWHG